MNLTRAQRLLALEAHLQRRVLVLDGAMGTALQGVPLTAADFGGPAHDGCNEQLNLTRPDVIEKIHRDYFEAGADIAETNSFGSARLVLAEYGLGEQAYALSRASAAIARKVADTFATAERPRWVAGSMGPTTKAISVTGGVTFEELIATYHEQARGLHDGGVDYFLIETCQDTRNIKAAILGIQQLFTEGLETLPIAVSGTIETMGTLLAGQTIEALMTSLEHVDLLYLGLNCATGPEFMTDHLRALAKHCRTRVACVPNAGLPDTATGRYLESPEMMARTVARFGEAGWLNLIGGCCGTTAAHVRALAEIAKTMKVRAAHVESKSTLSGVDYLEVTDEARPVIVGERTNVLGSKKFKELIRDGKFDEATEIAKAQVRRGAQVIDVCLQDPDRDESVDMRAFLDLLIKKVRAPLMIDTTDAKVLELALTYCQGKSIINSVNLEDGLERFDRVVPIARRFGAALVVGCIDEDKQQAQAITRARKVEIAVRSAQILTERYGMQLEDLYFDPLVFPCATGDQNYVGSALETIEGVRLIKQALPRCKTVLGISNVSFGLPPAGREVLNSVFLYHCVQAGLDMALVNAEKLERYPQIPLEERELSENLLFNRGADPVAAFAAHFRDRKVAKASRSTLPRAERIARCVVEGSKDGLTDDLAEELKLSKPLDIINGPLMAGMDEVGRLFNANELIVAEVLQSAEVMKAAVTFLEPHMDRASSASRGKVVLATVKGDVHDIGKNLVDIILTNNGFQVVNLGIKVPPEKIIEAVREHRPDVLGLSGLLVKSALQMVVTAEDLSRAGVHVPMLVGGAALSPSFVDKQISHAYAGTVAYASDVMTGLELAKQMANPTQLAVLQKNLQDRRSKLPALVEAPRPPKPLSRRSKQIEPIAHPPQPPDFERHVLEQTPLDQIWSFINPMMLYGRHLGLKGSVVRQIETASASELSMTEAGQKALELREMMADLRADCRSGLMKTRSIFQFFRAASDGDVLQLLSPDGKQVITSFDFGRQPGDDGLCLADYVASRASGVVDSVALFVTTAGEGIRGTAERFKQNGDYLRCHALQALALETAEAYAELIHGQIRSQWGFSDGPEISMLDRFRANYRGKRFSFGYPACPRLEDQQQLFSVLKPEDIGVQLTDGCMMDPEASVSAIVFHHPQAAYFSINDLSEMNDVGALPPPLSTLAIGSLPHTQLELALQQAFRVDVPAMPQLPGTNPAELMVPQALEGLPGLTCDSTGECVIDRHEWQRGARSLSARLERALRGKELSYFEPNALSCRAWRPFLWDVAEKQKPWAKAQLCGPMTLRLVIKLSDGAPLSDAPELEQQVLQLTLARATAMARALKETGTQPLFFLDEPGLYAFDKQTPAHLVALQGLKIVILALKKEGARVGVHCCSNTDWASILGLGFDLVSLDARLSLGAILAQRGAVEAFFQAGGRLVLGAIPTNLLADYDVEELVAVMRQTVAAHLGDSPAARVVLTESLLSPHTGLALRSVGDAERVFMDLRRVQKLLR